MKTILNATMDPESISASALNKPGLRSKSMFDSSVTKNFGNISFSHFSFKSGLTSSFIGFVIHSISESEYLGEYFFRKNDDATTINFTLKIYFKMCFRGAIIHVILNSKYGRNSQSKKNQFLFLYESFKCIRYFSLYKFILFL